MYKICNLVCLILLLPMIGNAELIKVIQGTHSRPKGYIYYDNNKEIAREKLNEDGTFISFEGTIPDGVVREYEKKDVIFSEETWKNNVREGVSKRYFHSKLMYEKNYKNGKLDGKSTFYYPSGKSAGETIWKDGKKEGISTNYYEDGSIQQEAEYKDGRQISRKEYDRGGNLIKSIHE